MLDAMRVLGPYRVSAQGGLRAADWGEIADFARATKRISHHEECELMFQMCGAFLQGLHTGENPMGISPVDRKK